METVRGGLALDSLACPCLDGGEGLGGHDVDAVPVIELADDPLISLLLSLWAVG
jgi:hypothetical protein